MSHIFLLILKMLVVIMKRLSKSIANQEKAALKIRPWTLSPGKSSRNFKAYALDSK